MSRSDAIAPRPGQGLFDRTGPAHPAVLFMACLPLQWIEVARLGGFDIVLPYLAVLLAVAVAVLSDAHAARGLALSRAVAPVLAPYAVYLLVITVALHGSPAQGTPVRQVFFLLSGLAFGTMLTVGRDPARVLRQAGLAAPVVFVVVTEIIARGLGTGWIEALTRFFVSGDLQFLTYSFFRDIFNAQFDTDEPVVAAAQKNAVAVSLLIAMQLHAAGRGPGRGGWPGRLALPAFLVLLLMLNARSVLLVAMVSLLLAGGIAALRARRIGLPGAVLAVFAALGAAAALVVVTTSDSAVVDTLRDRFTFSDHSTDGRLGQYGWAIARIDDDLLLGGGYAELHGQPVHNLFLGAFMHAGLAAFLLVVASYVALLAIWLRFCARIVMRPASWTLPVRAEWVAVLPLLPMFRIWVAGGAGHPALGEWTALMAFAALLALDRRAGRVASRRAAAPLRGDARALASSS